MNMHVSVVALALTYALVRQ